MPNDLTDILVHFALAIVIAVVISLTGHYLFGVNTLGLAFGVTMGFWAGREAWQYKERYPPHTWMTALNPLNWSRQKKLEGLAAPVAGATVGVLGSMVWIG